MKKIIQYDYYVEGQKVSVKPEEPIECSDDAEVERQRKILKEKHEIDAIYLTITDYEK